MRHQFTSREWSHINLGSNRKQKLLRFYRHWFLKESYVKAVGVGIGMNFLSLDFDVNQPLEGVVRSTQMRIDGILESSLKFEEQLLD